MNQTLTLLSLYSEFIACLVAASVLSLFAGWMLHKSSANKRLNASIKSWEIKLASIEAAAVADTDNLEEQLQDLALESKSLKATNKALTESLKKNDTTIQKARAEAIELNRQNSESQERLQRVIQQKEREIADRANGINYETDETMALQDSAYDPRKSASIISSALGVAFDDELDAEFEATLSDSIDNDLNLPTLDGDENALNNADTIAFNPAEMLDATVQMSTADFIHQNSQLALPDDSEFDDLIDETADVTGLIIEDLEESTVAIDDNSLAFSKQPLPVSNAD